MKNMMIGLVLLAALVSVGCGGGSGCDACSGDEKDACEAARDLCEDLDGCNVDEYDDAAEEACK